MKNLTERQNEILDFIKLFIKKHNYPPTLREIGEAFAISSKGAYDHIKALEKKGIIRCGKGRSRAIEIVDNEDAVVFIPLIYKVLATKPLFSTDNYKEKIALPASLINKKKACFALLMQEPSMLKAGIMQGDTAIFCEQNRAENGDIVLVNIQGSVTLERFYNEGSRMRFELEDKTRNPIYTNNAQIFGKLIGLIRRYS
jgi:repressor LexA